MMRHGNEVFFCAPALFGWAFDVDNGLASIALFKSEIFAV